MSKTLNDFSREKIYKICDEYAHSSNSISADYFCDQYGFKEGVFYGILKKGIKAQVIPDEWIPLIMKKSAENAYYHANEAGSNASERNYKWCIQKRKTFQFNNKETAMYAIDYACSPLSAEEYAKLNYMPKKLLNQTLQRAIEDNLIKDEIVFTMRIKALKFHPKENVDLHFNRMWEKRLEKIRLQKAKEEARKNRKKYT
jgi:hypothetical protein